jgi:hypothetical protein
VQPAREQPATLAHPTKHRTISDSGSGEPILHRCDGACDRAPTYRDHRAGTLLVGLQPPDGDAQAFRAFLEVGDVECHQLGPTCGQSEAEQRQGAVAFGDEPPIAGGDHGEQLVGRCSGFLERRHAEGPARAAHHGLDPLIIGRRCQPGELVAVSDPGDPAAERGAFDAEAGLRGDERRDGGRIGRQGAQTLLGAPCPEDREVAAVGALRRGRFLGPGKVGGALQRGAEREANRKYRAANLELIRKKGRESGSTIERRLALFRPVLRGHMRRA